MSVAVYQQSYKFPASILAFVVHGAFFALLYFGFSWQTQMPETMSVALWKSIPNDVPEQPAPPVAQVQPVPEVKPTPEVKPVPPPEVRKPDIVLPTKKPEPKKVEVKKIETKPVHPVEVKKTEVKPAVKPQTVQPPQPSAADIEADRQIAAQNAAVNRMVDENIARIQNKIHPNIVMPPDVPDAARVEFSVTLLPDGSVLSIRKAKPSGSTTYDEAVERAILKSQPLPLPPDANLARKYFRDFKLSFQPTK